LTEQGSRGRFLVDTNAIAKIVEPSLAAMGYSVVRVTLAGGNRRATLQIMAERIDDEPLTLDDCTLISHSVSALLDVADPIPGAYVLEISSPGIDRPLVRLVDYDRFSGREARIELSAPVGGRKRFRGRLLGTIGGDVRVATETGEMQFPFTAVLRAKLVTTDDRLSAATPRRH
jgi:ribosome maturation factor RimP